MWAVPGLEFVVADPLPLDRELKGEGVEDGRGDGLGLQTHSR